MWDILPEKVVRIEKDETPEVNSYNRYYAKDYCYGGCAFIKINWRGKTEITRPVDYESMIGCVGWFWDDDIKYKTLGILNNYSPETSFPFINHKNRECVNFRPAKKSELKIWGE